MATYYVPGTGWGLCDVKVRKIDKVLTVRKVTCLESKTEKKIQKTKKLHTGDKNDKVVCNTMKEIRMGGRDYHCE